MAVPGYPDIIRAPATPLRTLRFPCTLIRIYKHGILDGLCVIIPRPKLRLHSGFGTQKANNLKNLRPQGFVEMG